MFFPRYVIVNLPLNQGVTEMYGYPVSRLNADSWDNPLIRLGNLRRLRMHHA